MAAPLEEGAAGGLFPSIAAASLLAVTTGFLALCILCKRKDRNGVPLCADLPDEAMEPSTLGGSATSLQELQASDCGGQDPRAARALLPASLSKDDGTASSSSFIILPPRELPRVPSEEPLSPEQAYSNLSFPRQAPEGLYEVVTAGEDEAPAPPTTRVATGGTGGQAAGAEYARVLRVKKPAGQAEPDAGATPMAQEAVPIEEMYSVVCKDKKKKKKEKKKAKHCDGLAETGTAPGENNPGGGQVEAGDQESQGRARYQPSLFPSPITEPCYEAVSSESWMDPDRSQSNEPAYEAVGAPWNIPRRKEKPSRSIQAEHLYESIENVAFPFRNHKGTSHFAI